MEWRVLDPCSTGQRQVAESCEHVMNI